MISNTIGNSHLNSLCATTPMSIIRFIFTVFFVGAVKQIPANFEYSSQHANCLRQEYTQQEEPKCSFEKAGIQGESFAKKTFSHQIENIEALTDVDFSQANFKEGADFIRVVMNNVNFTGSKCNYGNFRDKTCWFREAIMNRVVFVGGDYPDATFEGVKGEYVLFTNANLRDGRFSDSEFENVSFAGADLKSTSFSNGIFINSDFKGASFDEKPPETASLSEGILHFVGIFSDVAAIWADMATSARNSSNKYRRSILYQSQFIDSDFTGASMKKVDARGVEFKGSCILKDTDWREADLRGVKFINCDLSDAKLSGVKMEKYDMFGIVRVTSFKKSKLQGVDISGLDFRTTVLDETDFFGAYYYADTPPQFPPNFKPEQRGIEVREKSKPQDIHQRR